LAGDHLFISTLLIDDPNMADEASLPTFQSLPNPSDRGGSTSSLGFEFDKRITENFGFAINEGYTWLQRPGDKTANGWNNIVVTLKYKPYVNAEHEFLMSIGVQRLFGASGANGGNGGTLGNATTGATAPTFYFGKGLGDLPVSWLRPLALTGELSYGIADTRLKMDPATGNTNNGNPNTWAGGMSLQYSLRYLSTQVKDFGFPEWVNRLTPVAELSWTSPASKPSNGQPVTYLFGIGLNYTATSYAISSEMLIPGNRNTGSHLGLIAQYHLYFDDLFPNSLGKPILDWF
jgi:hypothetical protein